MNIDQQIDHFFNLSQKLRSEDPPPVTLQEKQAAITVAEFEKCVHDLMEV